MTVTVNRNKYVYLRSHECELISITDGNSVLCEIFPARNSLPLFLSGLSHAVPQQGILSYQQHLNKTKAAIENKFSMLLL